MFKLPDIKLINNGTIFLSDLKLINQKGRLLQALTVIRGQNATKVPVI